jgi:hypothetical protein
MIVDRRRVSADRRAGDRLRVVFAVKSEIGPHVHLAQCEDLAPAGMSLLRPIGVPLAADMRVALSFQLPGSDAELSLAAVVVSDRRMGRFRRTGLRFTSARADVLAAIARYCERHRDDPPWADPRDIAAAT